MIILTHPNEVLGLLQQQIELEYTNELFKTLINEMMRFLK